MGHYLTMATKTFTGKFDTFVVGCTKCEGGLKTKPINEPLMSGTEVECVECGGSGIVYEDGGIYKMVDSDPPIEIRVQ